MEINRYNFSSILTSGYKDLREIIKWFNNTFSYDLIITTSLRSTNDYGIWEKEDFKIIQNPMNDLNTIDARFLFKNIEDKTLFDLTWR